MPEAYIALALLLLIFVALAIGIVCWYRQMKRQAQAEVQAARKKLQDNANSIAVDVLHGRAEQAELDFAIQQHRAI